jgi:hypothetical protein
LDIFGQRLDEYFIDKYSHRFDVAFSFPGNLSSKISCKICERIPLNAEFSLALYFGDLLILAKLA